MNYLINIIMFLAGFTSALILRKIVREITIKKRQNKFAMYNYGSTIEKDYDDYKALNLLKENIKEENDNDIVK